jgi:hypothetical protein
MVRHSFVTLYSVVVILQTRSSGTASTGEIQ